MGLQIAGKQGGIKEATAKTFLIASSAENVSNQTEQGRNESSTDCVQASHEPHPLTILIIFSNIF